MKKFLFSLLLFVIFTAIGQDTPPPPPSEPAAETLTANSNTTSENPGSENSTENISDVEKKEEDEPKVYFDAKNRKITVTTTHEGIEVDKPAVPNSRKTFSFEELQQAREYVEFLIGCTHN